MKIKLLCYRGGKTCPWLQGWLLCCDVWRLLRTQTPPFVSASFVSGVLTVICQLLAAGCLWGQMDLRVCLHCFPDAESDGWDRPRVFVTEQRWPCETRAANASWFPDEPLHSFRPSPRWKRRVGTHRGVKCQPRANPPPSVTSSRHDFTIEGKRRYLPNCERVLLHVSLNLFDMSEEMCNNSAFTWTRQSWHRKSLKKVSQAQQAFKGQVRHLEKYSELREKNNIADKSGETKHVNVFHSDAKMEFFTLTF